MRKGMKKLCSSALSILLALSMVVPGAGVYHTNVKADDVVEKHKPEMITERMTEKVLKVIISDKIWQFCLRIIS